jgi:Holliday junction resolvase-like predicted endonuclease
MIVKRDILTSLLRLTKTGLVQKGLIKKEARVSVQVMESVLGKLSEEGFIKQKRDLIEVSPSQRISLAVQALKLGSDFEQVCRFLEWTEFEDIAGKAFEANRFRVLKNFRFKHGGKRWEIDVLGCREPLIVCVDCKHWHHGWSHAAIVKAAGAQTERTRAFAEALPSYYQKARLTEWKSATLIPLILSLIPGGFKFHNNVPIVPVLQLQDFINELPLEADSLTHFKKKIIYKEQKLTNYSKKRNGK